MNIRWDNAAALPCPNEVTDRIGSCLCILSVQVIYRIEKLDSGEEASGKRQASALGNMSLTLAHL